MERPKLNLHIKSRNRNAAEDHAEISKAAGHGLTQVWVLVGSLAQARCHGEAVLLPPGARRRIHWVFHCAVPHEINSVGIAWGIHCLGDSCTIAHHTMYT